MLKRISPSTWKIIFVLALLAPMAILTWKLFSGQLGAQPSEEMNHELGEFTYRYLAVNLIWGSLLALGWMPKGLRRWTYLRRHLGVVTFVYAIFHVAFYALKEGDVPLALAQVFEKTYLIIGLSAWCILLVLALTSTNWAVRRLGRNWKRLHRLAYFAILLATVHFYLIEKKDWRVVLPFFIPVLVLYLLRAIKSASSRLATRPSN